MCHPEGCARRIFDGCWCIGALLPFADDHRSPLSVLIQICHPEGCARRIFDGCWCIDYLRLYRYFAVYSGSAWKPTPTIVSIQHYHTGSTESSTPKVTENSGQVSGEQIPFPLLYNFDAELFAVAAAVAAEDTFFCIYDSFAIYYAYGFLAAGFGAGAAAFAPEVDKEPSFFIA